MKLCGLWSLVFLDTLRHPQVVTASARIRRDRVGTTRDRAFAPATELIRTDVSMPVAWTRRWMVTVLRRVGLSSTVVPMPLCNIPRVSVVCRIVATMGSIAYASSSNWISVAVSLIAGLKRCGHSRARRASLRR